LQNYSFGILISDASSGDLAVNINGDIYSVNRNYNKVSIYAPDPYGSNNYKLSKQWNFDGNQSTGGGIAISPSGDFVYLLTGGGQTTNLAKFNAAGNLLATSRLELDSNTFSGKYEKITTDGSGNIYVFDYIDNGTKQVVKKLGSNFKKIGQWQIPGQNYANCMAVTSSGKFLYATDLSGSVARYDLASSSLTRVDFATTAVFLDTVAVDRANNVYFAGASSSFLRTDSVSYLFKYGPAGILSAMAVNAASANDAANFTGAGNIAVDSFQTIYVSQALFGKIMKYNLQIGAPSTTTLAPSNPKQPPPPAVSPNRPGTIKRPTIITTTTTAKPRNRSLAR